MGAVASVGVGFFGFARWVSWFGGIVDLVYRWVSWAD